MVTVSQRPQAFDAQCLKPGGLGTLTEFLPVPWVGWQRAILLPVNARPVECSPQQISLFLAQF